MREQPRTRRNSSLGGRARHGWVACSGLLLLGLSLVGCVKVEDRYIVVECEIAELASQPVKIMWFEGTTLVNGSPAIDGSCRDHHVPLEDARRLSELAKQNGTWFIGALEKEKGGGGTTSVLERHADLSLDSAGRATVHFVRTRSSQAWIRDAETGLALASADGLRLTGTKSEWVCVVPPGALKGVLWRRSLGAPDTWKQVGRVERVRVVPGGDVWNVSGVP